MIHKYRFKNFFSFAEETEVSFVLNRQVPNSDLVFESPGGTRLSKLLAAIGPNASGKTNVLKPLSFLRWFIPHSFTTSEPDDEIPVRSHFFSDDGRQRSLKLNSRTVVTITAIRWSLTRNGWYMNPCIKRQASSSASFSGVIGLRRLLLMTYVSRISDLQHARLKKSVRMHR